MRAILATVAVLAACTVANAQAPTPSTISQETSGRVLRLLEGTGYRYEKLSATTWVLNFKGDHLQSIRLYVIATDSEVTLLGVIGSSAEIDRMPGAARQLLKFNDRIDGLTFLIDAEDDYCVMLRHQLKQLNTASFKASVEIVANAADDGFGEISSLSTTTAPAPGVDTSGTSRAPASASHSVEVLNGAASVAMDPNKWKEVRADGAGHRNFHHASGEVFAAIIAERLAIPMDKLKALALVNAKQASPDMKVVEESRRTVNGVEVLTMRFEGTVNGVRFAYLGLYYGGEQGVVQVLTYTGRNLFDEYRSVMEEFLNGFKLK
jgi:hypothetical protein